ncbi:WGR domain-containing protein [Catenulispora acidiphila DSM 44928]|uniref:WGR domain-containing protein n=1 Tax=Catenulispora acidiphila (strain DSM 44928 / JCM 14897 / NBRC 102108 / NRRL B-24433 / ID139908) TaxID=479433 RepID=C7PYX7_CATAD|nr:WGR domain-containing protein [Catenulispora acidiphila DSM 44928]
MGYVLEPVDAVAGLFDRRFDPRTLVIPRRDGKSGDAVAPVEPAADAVAGFERVFTKAARTVELVLGHADTDGDLAEAVRQPEFGDLAAMTPQQAAIAAVVVLYDAPKNYEPYVLVDAWVAARGLAFAAAATIEIGGFGVWIPRKGQKIPALRRKDHDAANAQERFAMAARMRRYLAAADADEYAAALADISALRSTADVRNTFISFLFPEHGDWVEQDVSGPLGRRWEVRDGLAAWLLIGAVSTPQQAERLTKWVHADALRLCSAATATMVATIGLDLIPAIANWAEDYWDGVEARQRVQRLLAGFDSDDAFLALLGQLAYRGTSAVLAEAAQRFPERGVRLLAEAAPDQPASRTAVDRVLRLTVTSRTEAARAVVPQLDAEARARVEKLMNGLAAPLPSASLDALPELLTTPPWEQARETVKPVVVKDLIPPSSSEVLWLDDQEREDWRADTLGVEHSDREDWGKRLAKALGRRNAYQLMVIVIRGPEEEARRALRNLQDGYSYDALDWCSTATARFGIDAFPAAMSAVRTSPLENAGLLLPFACSEIAPLVADWNLRLKTLRSPAQAWMRRHPALTVRTLIPAALGKAGRTRQAAEAALRFLVSAGFQDEIRAEAATYGTEADAGVVQLLAQDPLFAGLPKTMPEPPSWAEPESLPQLLITGRKEALPPSAVRSVVRMLMVSGTEDPYPGLETVKELCDTRSLEDFAWGVFENWQTADHPAKQSFAMDALRWFGGDEAVRRLSPLIRVWPGDGGHSRAVAGLDVLTAIGGDTALLHLYGISQKGKFRGLKESAQERVASIAKELRLTRDQLGDRLVPDLGLDGSGSMELDYGPRRFRVFFDEQLKPGVSDESGKRLKSLPKPGVKDDAELAPAAYQRFSGLKKDVRTLAADQITRLEMAMVARRRWTKTDFEEYFVGHPLLRHLVRRLVWSDFRPDGTGVRGTFRVAEDASYADVADDPYTLPDDALIGVAHPVDLGEDLPRWSELFADYEILQPFRQLGRPVLAFTAEESELRLLTRFAGVRTPAGKVLGLERRGWKRSDPADGGWQGYLLRELPDGRTAVVELEPGFGAGWAGEAEDQLLSGVWISTDTNRYTGYWRRGEGGELLASLDPVTASEILNDLSEVTAG